MQQRLGAGAASYLCMEFQLKKKNKQVGKALAYTHQILCVCWYNIREYVQYTIHNSISNVNESRLSTQHDFSHFYVPHCISLSNKIPWCCIFVLLLKDNLIPLSNFSRQLICMHNMTALVHSIGMVIKKNKNKSQFFNSINKLLISAHILIAIKGNKCYGVPYCLNVSSKLISMHIRKAKIP